MATNTLPADYTRCLAHDTMAPMRKRPPQWCPMRETCARALALRTDPIEWKTPKTPIEFRVCEVGKTDKHIEAQHNAGVTGLPHKGD